MTQISGTYTVSNAQFIDIEHVGQYGGALSFSDSFVVIKFCDFIRCVAKMGGAIFSENSVISVGFSDFYRDRCTEMPAENELGGNAICSKTGEDFQADYSYFIDCAQSDDVAGESLIVSHADNNQLSYINVSHCIGDYGGIVSIRCETRPLLSFINAADSQEFSLIEVISATSRLYKSNFIQNSVKYFISGYVASVSCVFVHNSYELVYPGGDISYTDCFGDYPGSSDQNFATIKFPDYRLGRETRRIKHLHTLIYLLSIINIFISYIISCLLHKIRLSLSPRLSFSFGASRKESRT